MSSKKHTNQSKKEKKQTRQDSINYQPLFIAMAIILLIWVGFWVAFTFCGPNLTLRGQIGDSFGVINSLFSALAFGGIIYTIILQRNELILQRKELEQTRLELGRAAAAQEKSEKQLERQSNNLKETAKLNALNSLLVYYIELGKSGATPEERDSASEKQKSYMEKIKAILNKTSI